MSLPLDLVEKRVASLQQALDQANIQAQRAHNQVMLTQGALAEAQTNLAAAQAEAAKVVPQAAVPESSATTDSLVPPAPEAAPEA